MNDKLVGRMSMVAMIGVIGLYMLQYIQQVLAPREVEYPEPYGILYLTPAGHIMNVSYGVEDEPVYFGEALPGTLNSEAGWRIYRYEYETIAGDLEAVGIRFAEGNTNFDKIWDKREDYEYG